MSDDLISRRALYDKAATLEAQALDYVGKLIERDGEETSVEWRIWSAILTERTAFKHDVYDAPSAQPERKKGKWIDAVLPNDNGGLPVQVCDQCNTFFPLAYTGGGHHYCPNCGARMEVEE